MTRAPRIALDASVRRLASRAAGAAGSLALAMVVSGLFPGTALGHPGLFHELERITAAIEKGPDSAALRIERAYHYRLNQQFPEALADCDRARSLDPRDTHVAAERGLTLSAMGRDREAEAELTRFIKSGGGNDLIFAERARIHERGGRGAAAVADYKAALALKPDVELYLACGSAQEGMKDLSGAAATYRAGLEKVGPAVTLQTAVIRVDTARGQYKSALATIDAAMSRSPIKTEWLLRRADVLEAAKRRDEARAARLAALAEAERVAGSSPSGMHLYWRARAHAALGNVSEAVHDLELTLMKAPRFIEAGELLARLRTSKDDHIQRTNP